MYESTVDVLYHLYDKLSIGGFVIMDDWYGFPSKTACEDFFQVSVNYSFSSFGFVSLHCMIIFMCV